MEKNEIESNQRDKDGQGHQQIGFPASARLKSVISLEGDPTNQSMTCGIESSDTEISKRTDSYLKAVTKREEDSYDKKVAENDILVNRWSFNFRAHMFMATFRVYIIFICHVLRNWDS